MQATESSTTETKDKGLSMFKPLQWKALSLVFLYDNFQGAIFEIFALGAFSDILLTGLVNFTNGKGKALASLRENLKNWLLNL